MMITEAVNCLTVNNEDVCISSRSSGNIQEVDMVLSQSHLGLIGGWVGRLAHIHPRKSSGIRHFQTSEIEEEYLALRQGIENIRVVIEDSVKGRRVEGTSRDALRRPGLCPRIIDVHSGWV